MSPNPNAIAAADAFDTPLTSVMAAGIVPALFGVVVTYFLAKRLVKKGSMVQDSEVETEHNSKLPAFAAAIPRALGGDCAAGAAPDCRHCGRTRWWRFRPAAWWAHF